MGKITRYFLKSQRERSPCGVGQNQVILPDHPNASYVGSSLEARIGKGAADREVINHLPWEGGRVRAPRGFLFVLAEGPRARKLLFGRFGDLESSLALVSVLRRRAA